MILLATVTYALHAIELPAGASLAYARPAWPNARRTARRFMNAALARNGQIAILLDQAAGEDRRILIVRPDGSRTVLHFGGTTAKRALASVGHMADGCKQAGIDLVGVVLAREGTPFITAACNFSGAYSGTASAALVWNGAWHVVPDAPPFAGIGRPGEGIRDNVVMAGADTPDHFAFTGDYGDSYPGEDLVLARDDPHWQTEVSGVAFDSRNVFLGEGNATAMSGDFVAGFYADLKLTGTPLPPVAALWHCPSNAPAHSCRPYTKLGPGVAFGVDAHGTVVGDDEATLGGPGFPTIWRDRIASRLSSSEGTAYAIGEDGTIAGVLEHDNSDASGFVASAHDFVPQAHPLDGLILDRGGLHVERAVGVDDSGDILAYVVRPDGKREVALLTPARHL